MRRTGVPEGTEADRRVVDAITRAFDVTALTWGEQHPAAELLSLAMREAARTAIVQANEHEEEDAP